MWDWNTEESKRKWLINRFCLFYFVLFFLFIFFLMWQYCVWLSVWACVFISPWWNAYCLSHTPPTPLPDSPAVYTLFLPPLLHRIRWRLSVCFRCMCSQYVQWPVCVRARAGVFVREEKRFKKKKQQRGGCKCIMEIRWASVTTCSEKQV